MLARNSDRILDGSGKNICFIGLRRIGKSLILKEYISRNKHKNILPVYMDFERLDTTPEFFAVQYVGQILRWFLDDVDIIPYLDIDGLMKKVADTKSDAAVETVHLIFDELNKARPNQRLLLELAFVFPERFANEQDVHIMLMLDEFQRIHEIDNFPQIHDIIGLLRSIIQTQSRTHYAVAGSAIRMLEKVFGDADSPFFAQFRVERVAYFEKKASFDLAQKITGISDSHVLEKIHDLTFGHPYYIYSICERMNELDGKNVNGARKAFALETLLKNGSINLMCRYFFESSMSRVRGDALMKTILRKLAKEDGLRLTDIAQFIKRKDGVTRNMLERLIDIDLIVKEDKRYYFRDPVFRYWIMNVYEGVEFDIMPGKRVIEDMVRDIEEKFEKASTELGIAKEYELKYTLEKSLGILFNKYLKDDIEFDLVGLNDGIVYIFEIKWRAKETGYRDIEKFMAKTKASEFAKHPMKLIVISRRGFTKQAMKYAKSQKIILVTQNEISKMKNLIM